MQTRTQSLIEVGTSYAIGFISSVILQLIVYPLFGIEVNLSQNLGLAVIFYAVAIVRGFGLRRFFNWLWESERNVAS